MFHTGCMRLDAELADVRSHGVLVIAGNTSSGRTALGLSMLRETHLRGNVGAYLYGQDMPSKSFMKAAGTDECLVGTVSCAEELVETVHAMVDNGATLIAVDTPEFIQTLGSTRRLVGDTEVHSQDRCYYHMLTTVYDKLVEKDATLLLIVQTGMDVKNKRMVPKLSKSCVTWANAVVHMDRLGHYSEYGEILYTESSVRVSGSGLSKKSTPFKLKVWTEEGIIRAVELFDYLDGIGALKRAGAYWDIGEYRLGPGRAEAYKQLDWLLDTAYTGFSVGETLGRIVG